MCYTSHLSLPGHIKSGSFPPISIYRLHQTIHPDTQRCIRSQTSTRRTMKAPRYKGSPQRNLGHHREISCNGGSSDTIPRGTATEALSLRQQRTRYFKASALLLWRISISKQDLLLEPPKERSVWEGIFADSKHPQFQPKCCPDAGQTKHFSSEICSLMNKVLITLHKGTKLKYFSRTNQCKIYSWCFRLLRSVKDCSVSLWHIQRSLQK